MASKKKAPSRAATAGRKKAAKPAAARSSAKPQRRASTAAKATPARKTQGSGSAAARQPSAAGATKKKAAASRKADVVEPKKAQAKKPEAARATARRPPATKRQAEKPSPRGAASARKGATRPRRQSQPPVPTTLEDLGGPAAVPGLTEEDQIRLAKFLPRELPKRLFEEERFLFPETYGVNRIRLLVRDPEWIFAYWDVNPEGMRELARQIGERTLALSRLTLRVVDPVSGASTDILLPPGARWWYIRTDSARRTYRAELGVTMPSGEFRRIAESNTVVTPRVGPSSDRVRRRMHYADAWEIPLAEVEAAAAADERAGLARGPWAPGAVEGAEAPAETERSQDAGGASDAFRSGASDAFRR